MFSKKEEKTVAYSLERCNKCNKEQKREFFKGDYVFLKTKKCDSCDGDFIIEKIFGEKLPT